MLWWGCEWVLTKGGATKLPLFICCELTEWCKLFWIFWGWGLLWLFIISSKLIKSDFEFYVVKLVPCSVTIVWSLCWGGTTGAGWPKSIISVTATLGGDEVLGCDWTVGLS